MIPSTRPVRTDLICRYLIAMSLGLPFAGFAEETVLEKVETKTSEAVDATKRAYRSAEDKTCEWINGKMQCFEKKVKNKVKNLSDKTKTKAKEIENKTN